jgi:hypothetical protein
LRITLIFVIFYGDVKLLAIDNMKTFTFLIFVTFFFACAYNKKNNSENALSAKSERPITERLDDYFSDFEIKPSIVINNIQSNQTDIQLSTHTIKWINSEKETKIKINNDLFTLEDKETLNVVWEHKDTIGFANIWNEIKLFKFNHMDLIGIRMTFQPCIGNDDKIDYVSKTFNGDAQGSTPMEFIYELYSMDDNGQFEMQKNSSGLPYQLKHTTFPNDTTKTDKFEQNWITQIK